jgi:hypothetical protein
MSRPQKIIPPHRQGIQTSAEKTLNPNEGCSNQIKPVQG